MRRDTGTQIEELLKELALCSPELRDGNEIICTTDDGAHCDDHTRTKARVPLPQLLDRQQDPVGQ